MKAHPSDEECGTLACRFFWGVTEALKEGETVTLNERFLNECAIESLILFLNAGVKEDASIDAALKCIQNIANLHMKIDGTVRSL